ncbi:hypothetical protein EPO04_02300 [Patescibacteria group bacterium]|nr:MAG: hypothetical protein EPO04_02300 [Patescibacteria group bacterium]
MQPNQNPNLPTPPNPEQPAPAASEAAPQPIAPERAPQAPTGGPTDPVARPVLPDVNGATNGNQGGQPSAQPPAGPATPVAGAPAVAGDVDVIEKEWVDQANRIVEQTKQDPYTEEEAVEALQADYLKKRYGHEVKKPDSK